MPGPGMWAMMVQVGGKQYLRVRSQVRVCAMALEVVTTQSDASAPELDMAVPPTGAHLGKSTRDVFTKGYGFGLIKPDLKPKSENGLQCTSSVSANTEPTTEVSISLETQYRCPKHGLTSLEKYNTDNTLGMETFVEDQLACGLKLTFDSSSHQVRGGEGAGEDAKIKTGHKQEAST